MVDRVALGPSEYVLLDTTNNTITVVLCTTGNVEIRSDNNRVNVEIRNDNDRVYAFLQAQFELYTLAINTGLYYVVNVVTGTCTILIIREFIY